jgi:NADH-quinone oxidoreductase subunit C
MPQQIAERIAARYPDTFVAREEATLLVAREDLREALLFLREDPGLSFDFFACVTATDWPDKDPRYWVIYELRSMEHKHRVRVKVGLPADDPRIPSVTDLFPTANWHERETFDFFGIVFDGHPDLTRILLPDDWEGHPLLKTEELGGVNTRFVGAFIPPVDTRTTT